MQDQRKTLKKDVSTEDRVTTERPDEGYDLPIDLFAGVVIVAMGILVLVTPLITAMPADAPWNPTAMNIISGSIYLLIGMGFLYRAR
ncbi:hypothetical protein [Halegenticoccus tardaugens]|uniref:hypothetical protein n=1 Tax=Halegenticoccus tardaugens TaxID=2071624 RepID=UPI00100A4C01|nr:hypothetical protein [Halegenticoccus tardaugens]